MDTTDARLPAPIDDLHALPAETAWLGFRRGWNSKENDTDPRAIGRLICAVSNAARLEGRVVNAVEEAQLPPPEFRAETDATRVIPFGPRRFADMTAEERLRACCRHYQHAVLR